MSGRIKCPVRVHSGTLAGPAVRRLYIGLNWADEYVHKRHLLPTTGDKCTSDWYQRQIRADVAYCNRNVTDGFFDRISMRAGDAR